MYKSKTIRCGAEQIKKKTPEYELKFSSLSMKLNFHSSLAFKSYRRFRLYKCKIKDFL